MKTIVINLVDFNPRSPWGERPLCLFLPSLFTYLFQSTLSVRRATQSPRVHKDNQDISIHALREESDKMLDKQIRGLIISIHALREESDSPIFLSWLSRWYFNPRSPWGERQPTSKLMPRATPNFNPRSPWGERPPSPNYTKYIFRISIHALREESDMITLMSGTPRSDFNPRSPWGERPYRFITNCSNTIDFNPRSPWGERRCWKFMICTLVDFNPRSPWGERHDRWPNPKNSK